MDLIAALALIRAKYSDEIHDVNNSVTTEKYKEACENYPALMNIAHQIVARELFKETGRGGFP